MQDTGFLLECGIIWIIEGGTDKGTETDKKHKEFDV
jgi:hypothetical protein